MKIDWDEYRLRLDRWMFSRSDRDFAWTNLGGFACVIIASSTMVDQLSRPNSDPMQGLMLFFAFFGIASIPKGLLRRYYKRKMVYVAPAARAFTLAAVLILCWLVFVDSGLANLILGRDPTSIATPWGRRGLHGH